VSALSNKDASFIRTSEILRLSCIPKLRFNLSFSYVDVAISNCDHSRPRQEFVGVGLGLKSFKSVRS